jgi:CrcB protein
MGMAVAYFSAMGPQDTFRLFVMTGFLGGFTTFSAFSAESLLMLQRGQYWLASMHTLSHVLGALAMAALGFALMQALRR